MPDRDDDTELVYGLVVRIWQETDHSKSLDYPVHNEAHHEDFFQLRSGIA